MAGAAGLLERVSKAMEEIDRQFRGIVAGLLFGRRLSRSPRKNEPDMTNGETSSGDLRALDFSTHLLDTTLNEVRDKIEQRYARATGAAELAGASVEAHMLEVEQAQANVEAQARLAAIKEQLGLSAPADATASGDGISGTPQTAPSAS